MKKSLKFHDRFLYGIGGLGYSSMSQTMGNFIMFFATAVMGISGSLVGIAIAISSLWDGVSDPLIGYLSDNNRNKFFGKRLGFMFFGIFAIAFLNICIWSMPAAMPEIAKFFGYLLECLLLKRQTHFLVPLMQHLR